MQHYPQEYFHLFLGAPFVISMSNIDFIQQRLDSLMEKREKKYALD